MDTSQAQDKPTSLPRVITKSCEKGSGEKQWRRRQYTCLRKNLQSTHEITAGAEASVRIVLKSDNTTQLVSECTSLNATATGPIQMNRLV